MPHTVGPVVIEDGDVEIEVRLGIDFLDANNADLSYPSGMIVTNTDRRCLC